MNCERGQFEALLRYTTSSGCGPRTRRRHRWAHRGRAHRGPADEPVVRETRSESGSVQPANATGVEPATIWGGTPAPKPGDGRQTGAKTKARAAVSHTASPAPAPALSQRVRGDQDERRPDPAAARTARYAPRVQAPIRALGRVRNNSRSEFRTSVPQVLGSSSVRLGLFSSFSSVPRLPWCRHGRQQAGTIGETISSPTWSGARRGCGR